jgi:hypothetical protein
MIASTVVEVFFLKKVSHLQSVMGRGVVSMTMVYWMLTVPKGTGYIID